MKVSGTFRSQQRGPNVLTDLVSNGAAAVGDDIVWSVKIDTDRVGSASFHQRFNALGISALKGDPAGSEIVCPTAARSRWDLALQSFYPSHHREIIPDSEPGARHGAFTQFSERLQL